MLLQAGEEAERLDSLVAVKVGLILVATDLVALALVVGFYGWEAGTRTPIARSRVWSPTIGRPPSKGT